MNIPQLFKYNALTIISDRQTTLHGMFSSPSEWFASWKSANGTDVVEGDFARETLINGLLRPECLLHHIRLFIFHELSDGQLLKRAPSTTSSSYTVRAVAHFAAHAPLWRG